MIVRQRKSWGRKDGVFLCFEDNAGVIVNVKGEPKGSAITGPVAKECADLWPRIASNASKCITISPLVPTNVSCSNRRMIPTWMLALLECPLIANHTNDVKYKE